MGRDGAFQFGLPGLLRRGWHLEEGLSVAVAAVQPLFTHVVEEGEEAVKITLGNGIVFVIVAARAAHGEAQPGGGGGFQTVHHILHLVLFGHGTALEIHHVVAVETAGQFLFCSGVRQKVARQLFNGELVIRHVVVEGRDDPIAPVPHFALAVDVIAVRIGVARQIQPLQGHALAKARGLQQGVHTLLIGIRRFVAQKGIELRHGGRQACEIVSHATQQGGFAGLGRVLQAFAFQAGQHEVVDRVTHPAGFLYGGCGWRNRRDKRPVSLPFCALINPLFQGVDLWGREGAARIGRGHALVAGGGHAGEQMALCRLAGHDDTAREGTAVGCIKAQIRHALRAVRTMTRKAVVRENGANIAVEINGGPRDGGGQQDGKESFSHFGRTAIWRARSCGDRCPDIADTGRSRRS